MPDHAGVAGHQGQVGHLLRVEPRGAQRQRGQAVHRTGVEGPDDLVRGQFAGGQRGALALDQRGVRGGQAAHGLGGVVDQDVERALLRDPLGEGHGLGGVAQVDADDLQAVQPVRGVVHRLEAADGVLGETGGDRGVRAVAQQPERDVHADLGAAAGEQRALAGEVGAGVAAGPVLGGAVLAELVVEVVDLGVALLADVAGAGPLEYPGDGALLGARGGQQALGLVVDALGGPGGGGLGDRLVVGGLGSAALLAAALLDRAVDVRGGPADRDRVGVVDVQLVEFLQYVEAERQPFGVDTGAVRGRRHLVRGRRTVLCHRHRRCRSLVTVAALREATAVEQRILFSARRGSKPAGVRDGTP